MSKEQCPKCGGPYVSYSSLSIRECIDCGYQKPWQLKAGQQPLVKHQR